MNKKQLSERDICSKFINPALQKAGWDMQKQVREELSFTDGRIIVQGNLHTRGKRKRAEQVIKRDYFSKYEGKAKLVLEAVLHKYIESGVTSIEETSVLKLKPLSDLGSAVELVNAFGKRKDFEKAIKELEDELYGIA